MSESTEALLEEIENAIKLWKTSPPDPRIAKKRWKEVWREYRKALHGRLTPADAAVYALIWDPEVEKAFSRAEHPIDRRWWTMESCVIPWKPFSRVPWVYVKNRFYRRSERKPGTLQGIERKERIHELRKKFPNRKALKV